MSDVDLFDNRVWNPDRNFAWKNAGDGVGDIDGLFLDDNYDELGEIIDDWEF